MISVGQMLNDPHSQVGNDPALRAVSRWNPEEIDTPTERLAEAVQSVLPNMPAFRIAQAIEQLAKDGHLTEIASDAGHSDEQTMVRTMLLFSEFSQSANIIARCFSVARGLPLFPDTTTQTAIGTKFGLQRATVSSIVIKIRDKLGIKNVPGLRSDEVREECAKRQTGRRARPEPATYRFQNVLINAIAKH